MSPNVKEPKHARKSNNTPFASTYDARLSHGERASLSTLPFFSLLATFLQLGPQGELRARWGSGIRMDESIDGEKRTPAWAETAECPIEARVFLEATHSSTVPSL
jgi:hypothetical protein